MFMALKSFDFRYRIDEQQPSHNEYTTSSIHLKNKFCSACNNKTKIIEQ